MYTARQSILQGKYGHFGLILFGAVLCLPIRWQYSITAEKHSPAETEFFYTVLWIKSVCSRLHL